MADSSQYNLSLIITANNKAVEELNKIWKSVDNVKWWITKLSESTKKTLKTIWATATVITWTMVALWKSCIDSALEIEPVKNAYSQLTKSVWADSEEMLKSLREASKWAVKDYDLMLAANTSMKLWVATNTEDMTQLMKIARLYWQQMGQDVSSSFDDIVRWLWRGSAQILDNLWIIIDSEKAYEEYARTIWKTANELTKAEKTTALVNATLEEWKKALEEFWEPAQTMQERMAELWNNFENIKVKLWEALVPMLEKVLEKITPVIEKVADWIEQNPELAAKIWIAVAAVSWLVAILSWLALALPWITTAISILWNKFTILWWAITGVRWWLNRLEDKIESTDEKVKKYQDAIEDLKWQLERWEISQEQFTEAVEVYKWKIQEAYAESQTFWQYLKDQLDDTLKVMTFDTERRKQALEDFWIIFNAVWNMFDEIAEYLIWTAILAREWFWNIVNTVWWFFDSLTESMVNFVRNGIDKVMWKIDSLISKLKNLIATAKEAISAVWWKISDVWSSAKDTVSWRFKAWWWTVYWWQPYIVWEKWPELFVPNQKWSIVPNNQITNNNGISINMNWITVRSEADIQNITDEIIRKIKLEKNFWIA